MNIIELRNRLTNIIEENDRRFPKENRNQHTVFVHNKTSKRKNEYLPIQNVDGSLYGFIDEKNGFVINVKETDKLVYGGNNKKVSLTP